jgi:glutamate-ammonia-ligase adenylyltransferase
MTSSPDPDPALNHLEALISSAGARETLYSFFEENPQAMESVIRLFSNSEYLSRIVIRHPEMIDFFLDPAEMLKKRTKEEMQEGHCGSYSERLDVLRKFKYTEELRIGYTDVLGSIDTIGVSRNISTLADVSVACALKIAGEELERTYGLPLCERDGKRVPARFCIVGMGKLGGEELTYGSDLDIMFIYSGEGETDGGHSISNHEYFSLLSGKMISVLTALTREGTVFRVDVRLRPSGSKGPLCQSLEAVTTYIKDHAEIWELQSLTRARVIAGDESLGSEFISESHQLVYERPLQGDLPAVIREMRRRMEAEVCKEDSDYYDIKVGIGGIVDIEFIVQYLKLLHGAEYSGIRIANTLLSLESLYKEKLLSKDRYSLLKRSYLFLRTLESRIRIVQNTPSHLLPRNPEKLTSLAHRMGYKDTKRISGGKRLIREYEDLRKKVRGVFEGVISVR